MSTSRPAKKLGVAHARHPARAQPAGDVEQHQDRQQRQHLRHRQPDVQREVHRQHRAELTRRCQPAQLYQLLQVVAAGLQRTLAQGPRRGNRRAVRAASSGWSSSRSRLSSGRAVSRSGRIGQHQARRQHRRRTAPSGCHRRRPAIARPRATARGPRPRASPAMANHVSAYPQVVVVEAHHRQAAARPLGLVARRGGVDEVRCHRPLDDLARLGDRVDITRVPAVLRRHCFLRSRLPLRLAQAQQADDAVSRPPPPPPTPCATRGS